MVGVLAVAVEAVLREDGPNVTVEVEFWSGRGRGGLSGLRGLGREGPSQARGESGAGEGGESSHGAEHGAGGFRCLELE